jgi:hypothetical protein
MTRIIRISGVPIVIPIGMPPKIGCGSKTQTERQKDKNNQSLTVLHFFFFSKKNFIFENKKNNEKREIDMTSSSLDGSS